MQQHTDYWKWIAGLAMVTVLILGLVLLRHNESSPTTAPIRTIQVVAGENFWGSLVSQLGGSHVHVLSVVSDPNADPHEYETNTANARAFAQANYVILNGAGYDTWGNKLLSAESHSGRRILTVADLLGKKQGDNPHFWYSPAYVNIVIAQMSKDLVALDPADSIYFQRQLQELQLALKPYQDRITTIAQQFKGTKVAATEDIFVYLASAAQLNLISPPAFIEAVAEGNDPPAASVVQFQQQLQTESVRVLVYNEQTVTPLTTSMKSLAAAHGIPIVGVTETMQPNGTSFQDWMNTQLIQLQNAMNAQRTGG